MTETDGTETDRTETHGTESDEGTGGPLSGWDRAAEASSHLDPGAVRDLLGVLAYGELTAFERMAADARLAPSLQEKVALAGMAVAEFGHYQQLHGYLERLGVEPAAAMGPFVAAVDAFHDSTAPSTWLEGLVKAYVGDGIATDFYREVAAFLDPGTKALVLEVLADTGHASFVVATVRAAVEAEPALSGRLALWARRLVGEALLQAHRVAVDREALTRLVAGGPAGLLDGNRPAGDRPAGNLAEVSRMLARITDAHSRRMTALGLSG